MPVQQSFHIGSVIRNALVFDTKNWPEGPPVNTEKLLETVERLFVLLHEREIDYLLVGGIALLRYVEGRNTEDLDLILAPSSLQALPEIKVSGEEPNFARATFEGLKIDLLLTRHPLFEKVLRDYATPQPFGERTIPCATVEGLLLLKLYALPSLYRQGNFARVGLYENDIVTLIYYYQPDLEPLFKALTAHLSQTDLQELRTIVAELRQRIQRFDQNSD